MQFLTSFRGIAAFFVMLYHVRTYIPENSSLSVIHSVSGKGYLAVDFFFILSGFIIAYRYSDWFQEGSFNQLGAYFVRRFSRIYPLHLLFLTAYLGVVVVLSLTNREVPEQFTASSFTIKLLLLDLWFVGTDYWNHWNVPSWTISGEFLAYLLFPFLVRMFRGSTVRIAMFAFAICFLIAGLYESIGYRSLGDGIGVLGLVRCILEFSLGILVFRIYESPVIIRFAVLWVLSLSGIAVALSLFFTENHLFIPILFVGILLSSLHLTEDTKRLLGIKPLIWLGDISFSVYLSHTVILYAFALAMPGSEVIFETAHVFMYIVSVLVVSHVTYHWVEVPGRSFIWDKFTRIAA